MLLSKEKSRSHTQFLSDELARRKARNPRYSLRAFAKHLDLDPSAFSRILKSKQVPTLQKCVEIVQKLQLSKVDAHHFLLSAVEQQVSQLTRVVPESAHLEVKIEPAWGVTRDAMSLAPDDVCIVGSDFRILFINPAGIANLSRIVCRELSAGDVIGKTREEVGLPEECSKPILEQERVVFRTGRSDARELKVTTGSVNLHFERRASPVFGKGGVIHSVLEISRDITDYKRMESERNHLLHRYKALHEISAALTASPGRATAARIIATEAASAVGSRGGAVYLRSDAAGFLELLAVTEGACFSGEAAGRFGMLHESSIFHEAIRTRCPVWATSDACVPDPGILTLVQPSREPAWQIAPSCALPLLANGECIGVIGFAFEGTRPIDASEREFLRTVASLCAQAVMVRSGRERKTLVSLEDVVMEPCLQHG